MSCDFIISQSFWEKSNIKEKMTTQNDKKDFKKC